MTELRLTVNGRVLDRRSFIYALSLTTATAGSLLAGRISQANPGADGIASLSLQGGGEMGTWHVDDMWGHMPRYAHPITCRVVHAPLNLETVDPADHAFVA